MYLYLKRVVMLFGCKPNTSQISKLFHFSILNFVGDLFELRVLLNMVFRCLCMFLKVNAKCSFYQFRIRVPIFSFCFSLFFSSNVRNLLWSNYLFGNTRVVWRLKQFPPTWLGKRNLRTYRKHESDISNILPIRTFYPSYHRAHLQHLTH